MIFWSRVHSDVINLRFTLEIGIGIGIGIERKIAPLYGKLNRNVLPQMLIDREPRIHYIKGNPHLIQLSEFRYRYRYRAVGVLSSVNDMLIGI